MPDDATPSAPERPNPAQFPPGVSGNPAGKPRGAKNATTRALEQLLEGDAEAITRKCVELAKAGDKHAMKLAMERLLPIRRGRPVEFDLPEVQGAADITLAHGAILRACASGTLSPEEAGLLATVLDAKRRSLETTEIVTRLDALEKAAAERSDR